MSTMLKDESNRKHNTYVDIFSSTKKKSNPFNAFLFLLHIKSASEISHYEQPNIILCINL